MRTTPVWILAAALAVAGCEAPATGRHVAVLPGAENGARVEVPAWSTVHFGTSTAPYGVVVTVPPGLPGSGRYGSVERGDEHPLYDALQSAMAARRSVQDPDRDVWLDITVIGSEIRGVEWGYGPRE